MIIFVHDTQAMFQEAPFKDWMIGSDKVHGFH